MKCIKMEAVSLVHTNWRRRIVDACDLTIKRISHLHVCISFNLAVDGYENDKSLINRIFDPTEFSQGLKSSLQGLYYCQCMHTAATG